MTAPGKPPHVENAHTYEITVDPSAIDANGHANNVEFVRWMQAAAIAHADAVGCTAATRDAGATWLVRSHRVEYKRPAFAGDRVRVVTWVADARRAFSLRKYRFERAGDGAVLAEGETDWVFVDVTTGRPRSIPDSIKATFDPPAGDGAAGSSAG
jgi:acyl-CoA thioester hydrolase